VGAWEAVRTVAALGLAPKRTLRAVLWVNEENGDRGGEQYANDLGPAGDNSLAKHSFMFETDSGAFTPFGIGVSCAPTADCGAAQAQLTLIGAALLSGIGSGNVSAGGGGTDVDPSCAVSGVPCIGLNVLDPRLSPDTNNPCIADSQGAWAAPPWTYSAAAPPYDSQYFWVHHSEADTMERMDPRQLNHVAASLAIWAYAVAQLPALLPRDEPAPPAPAGSGGGAPYAAIGGAVGAVAAVAALGFVWWKRVAGGACWKKAAGGESFASAYSAVPSQPVHSAPAV
jgi:carboxypeptidase Q